MISSAGYKKVKIQITTFQKEDSKKHSDKIMDKEKHRQTLNNESDRRFICTVCLNSNNCNDCGRIAKPCPICCKAYDNKNKKRCDNTNKKLDNKDALIHTYDHKTYNLNSKLKDKQGDSNKTHDDRKKERCNENAIGNNIKMDNSKIVQTSLTDLTQDLSLLKEVLTVFQSKKQIDIKSNNSQTVVMKDVSVATESQSRIDLKPKLTKSKIFRLSIDEDSHNNGNDFKVVNCSQPNNKKSHHSVDLIKHKSSSIPQMKLEELKHSLKEKTKSKDAIEEVNRMFATVRRHEKSKNLEDHNRPMVRNGPRVLPVVKTNTYQEKTKGNSDSEMENKVKHETICKCCQTNNLQLSAGDSFFKHECCYHKMLHEGKCEKCVYMLCCQYQNHSKIETGALVCEHCRKPHEERQEATVESNHCDHF